MSSNSSSSSISEDVEPFVDTSLPTPMLPGGQGMGQATGATSAMDLSNNNINQNMVNVNITK